VKALLIEGSRALNGSVKISGSKNSSLPVMAASILAEKPNIIEDVPSLLDIHTMIKILTRLGAEVNYNKSNLYLDGSKISNFEAPHHLVNKMRASFLIVGPMLARHGRVKISLPGGCAIGDRPIDLHCKGLSLLGAEFTLGDGYVEASACGLKGNRVYLDYPSVGATENIMMAAVLAEGITVIENAALEPEVVDLSNLLALMGANISGAGSTRIKIEGVTRLRGVTYKVIPDRIEAGTYMIAAAMCGEKVQVKNVLTEHLKPLTSKLKEAGVELLEENPEEITVAAPRKLKAVDLKTMPYPGFPTDLQPQFTSLLSIAGGVGLITETIFENRFRHVEELLKMGADIKIKENTLVVRGQKKLRGGKVRAADLRGGASLVLAGLAAEGITEIRGVEHLDRGYQELDHKLVQLGGVVRRVQLKGRDRKKVPDIAGGQEV